MVGSSHVISAVTSPTSAVTSVMLCGFFHGLVFQDGLMWRLCSSLTLRETIRPPIPTPPGGDPYEKVPKFHPWMQ